MLEGYLLAFLEIFKMYLIIAGVCSLGVVALVLIFIFKVFQRLK